MKRSARNVVIDEAVYFCFAAVPGNLAANHRHSGREVRWSGGGGLGVRAQFFALDWEGGGGKTRKSRVTVGPALVQSLTHCSAAGSRSRAVRSGLRLSSITIASTGHLRPPSRLPP